MARGGKVSGKRNFRKKARSNEGGSDEDYVVSDDAGDMSDCPEEDISSLDGCASEESFGGFPEENEEIQRVRKFNRSKAKNGICGRRKIASKTSRKRQRITYAEQEEQEKEGDGDEDEDEDEDFNFDDDEEFTIDEEDYSDEEEETRGRKRKNNAMKMGKKVLRRKASVTSTRGRKRSRSRASKKPLRKKRRKNGGLMRKVQCDNADDFIDNDPTIRTKSRKKPGRKRRRLLEDYNSNSDCLSGSSDYEFTISEEEREQLREAEELCRSLRRSLRSSSLLVKNEEVGVHEVPHQQRKPPCRKGKEKIEESQRSKGKEKVEDLKSEVGKQVCGICLSEENKRRVRGVLNCCTHYFCFACIMEWSKVESRCPLCKQRFKTISEPAQSTARINLREMVIQVPERDQVYQPSEEELRSYIDPYENVICPECNEGGDDEFMLLCDICDSAAHTYCVGLGLEVTAGNWYCDGCRPVALGSSSSQVQERVADPGVTTQSLPVRFFEGGLPISRGGAPTLSERPWVHHHQIHRLHSIDRMTSPTGRTNGISATGSMSNLYSSQIDQSREPATQHTRTQEVGTSYDTFFEERLCNNTSPLMQNGDPFSTSLIKGCCSSCFDYFVGDVVKRILDTRMSSQ